MASYASSMDKFNVQISSQGMEHVRTTHSTNKYSTIPFLRTCHILVHLASLQEKCFFSSIFIMSEVPSFWLSQFVNLDMLPVVCHLNKLLSVTNPVFCCFIMNPGTI